MTVLILSEVSAPTPVASELLLSLGTKGSEDLATNYNNLSAFMWPAHAKAGEAQLGNFSRVSGSWGAQQAG